jgi:hypothetical protein
LVRLVVSSRSKSSLSDEELAEKTDEFCEGVARELYNRRLSRPELDAESPRESALSQQEYDTETVEKLKRKTGGRSVIPSFEVLREEYQHRGLWRSECDELWEDGGSLEDIRELVVALSDLRKELGVR